MRKTLIATFFMVMAMLAACGPAPVKSPEPSTDPVTVQHAAPIVPAPSVAPVIVPQPVVTIPTPRADPVISTPPVLSPLPARAPAVVTHVKTHKTKAKAAHAKATKAKVAHPVRIKHARLIKQAHQVVATVTIPKSAFKKGVIPTKRAKHRHR